MNDLHDRSVALQAALTSVLQPAADPQPATGPAVRPEAAAATAAPTDPTPIVAPSTRFDTLEQWVNNVYRPLAAAPRLPWCQRWWEHPAAYERLHWLWRAWEASMVAQEQDARSMSGWLERHFDYHRHVLQARDGVFADCTAGHRAVPPAVPPTDLTPSPSGDYFYDAGPLMHARHQLGFDDPNEDAAAEMLRELTQAHEQQTGGAQ